jgi:hypothetical protein
VVSRRVSSSAVTPPPGVSIVMRPILGCGRPDRTAGPLLSSRDHASRRDPPARWPERVSARAGREGRDRDRAAPDLVRGACPGPLRAGPPRGNGPGTDVAGRHRRDRGLGTASAARASRRHRRHPRPSLVGPRPLDPDLAVGRWRARAADRRGRRGPRRTGRHAGPPGPPDWRPGAAARELDRPDRPCVGHPAALDPGRGPAHARDLDHRHERQVHDDPAADEDPASCRPPRRDDDIRRHPRR